MTPREEWWLKVALLATAILFLFLAYNALR